MKKIAILGATGSIGRSALEVIKKHHDLFRLVLISGHKNVDELKSIAISYSVEKSVITSCEKEAEELCKNSVIFYGKNHLLDFIRDGDFDIVLNAVSGSAGLEYTMEALTTGKRIALANKESLVMAGHLIMAHVNSKNIIPVDSEHSAIFQALGSNETKSVSKLYITASGGAFRNLNVEELNGVGVKDALNHPTWNMGKKITVDSATMFNKALEIIEAHWLFSMSYSKIEALIHPQSIVHSMVEFSDGSIIAQLSEPSMQLPILYSFTHPKRIKSDLVKTDFIKIGELSFKKVDENRYPLFYQTINTVKEEGGLTPTVLNAANEAAVSLFLDERIQFIQICQLVFYAVNKYTNYKNPDLYTIIKTNSTVYNDIKSNYHSILTK